MFKSNFIKSVSLLLFFISSSAAMASVEVKRSIDFSTDPNPVTVRHDGVEVTLQPMFNGEGDIDVLTSVSAPGFQTLIVREGVETRAGYNRTVAIGKLSPLDAIPTVLLGTYTGGAHCCATLKALTPVAGRIKVVAFEPVDGEPTADFPNDIDGDSVRDFVRQDDRFRYQFAPGAYTFSPPVFYNIYKGSLIDVSDQPSFQPVWLKFANQMRTICSDNSNENRNGACVAYVAAGARLGRLSQFLAEASKHAYAGEGRFLPTGCKVTADESGCPEGQEFEFYTFETAAMWFLRTNGYIN